MIVLCIILALILLIFFVPYGIDMAYEDGELSYGIQIGPISIRLGPKPPPTPK